ncbi:MAG: hypothetical protein QXY15_09275, partial [Candidatus Nitrosotenuis sp.]
MHKIRVAVIYKKSYTFLSGNHFDNTSYHFFMHALPRNPDLDVSYFPSENQFDCNKLKGKVDIILLAGNNTNATPDELLGIKNLDIPVLARTADPHWAKKYNLFALHEKWKITHYFGLQPESYFHKFYPSDYKYDVILWGLEPSLYKNVKPFKTRIKNKILNSGNVGKISFKSKIANAILNPKKSSYYFYKLRSKCNDLPYVDYTGMVGNKYVNEDYPLYLAQYRASIAAATHYPVVKFFEIPAAGCLTFMEITEKNEAKYIG